MTNVGDVVLFKHLNELPFYEVCLVLSIDDKECTMIGKSTYGQYHMFKNIEINRIKPISEIDNVRSEIETAYDEAITLKKSEIKSVTFDEKEEEKMRRYERTKKMIMANCKKVMDDSITEEEFINRVKELANLKKQLFSPDKLECVSLIHKHNGGVKYECRKLAIAKQDAISKIGDKSVECFFEAIGRKVHKK